jgi:hypothetical protein
MGFFPLSAPELRVQWLGAKVRHSHREVFDRAVLEYHPWTLTVFLMNQLFVSVNGTRGA